MRRPEKQFDDQKLRPERRLSVRILKSMVIRVSLIVFLGALATYFHFYSSLESGSKDTLEKYVEQRTQRESIVFLQAAQSQALLKSKIKDFLSSPQAQVKNSKAFFDQIEKKADGTYRNKVGYDGTKMAGVFIPQNYHLTREKQNLIVYLKDLAETLGPAFRSNFQDTYFTTPENVMVIYWPEVPNWTLEMDPKFDMTQEEYVWIADEENNPDRKMAWTGLFYDKVARVWMTSAATPVYHGGRHILTIGHDIMLKELIDRAIKESLPGAYNVIFRADGRLILHPNKIEKLKAQSGYFNISDAEDSFLSSLKRSVLNAPLGASVVEHSETNDLLAFGKIVGPDWYFVTVYPRSLITASALNGIIVVIVLALLSLLLETVLIWYVVNREVGEPVNELFTAAKKLAKGDFNVKLPLERKDEIGAFAQAFSSMSRAILNRDKEIHEHALSLEKKIEERSQELDKQRAITVQNSKMASLGEMAGGIAHEINNPLAVIAGASFLISKHLESGEISEEKVKKLSSRIQSMVKRIESIIEGLRTFAHSGDRDNFRVEDLLSIVHETVTLCENKLNTSQTQLTIDEKGIEGISLLCQRVQLSQVILNLISNAIDSMMTLKPDRRWIHISGDARGGLVQIRVTDSGPGIPKEIQEKVFQPFFTTKEVGAGTGLGLSISLGIMKNHVGKLFVENDAKHTCFVMELPYLPEKPTLAAPSI